LHQVGKPLELRSFPVRRRALIALYELRFILCKKCDGGSRNGVAKKQRSNFASQSRTGGISCVTVRRTAYTSTPCCTRPNPHCTDMRQLVSWIFEATWRGSATVRS